jgi:catechol 2,3-dioxygenase-like lactoylglutathione lyase family enzyme
MIRRIGHVALRVPDLVAAVRHATEILGLREVERSGGTVYLTCDATHHGLQLIEAAELGFDHAGFEAAGPDGLERVREALAREGIEVIAASPQEEGLTEAVRFVAPGGLVFEVYDGIDHVDSHYNGPGVRPVKLQHITFRSSEMEQLERLFIALGFRVRSAW